MHAPLTEHQTSARTDALAKVCPHFLLLETVDSTQNQLVRLTREHRNLQAWTTILAHHQTDGRGKYQRRWLDTSGKSLLCSTLLHCHDTHLPWITLLAGLATLRALRQHKRNTELWPTGHFQLKWPNDIMIGEQKVGGILSEHIDTLPQKETSATSSAASTSKTIHRVAIGLGINLTAAPQFPDYPATSLTHTSPQTVNVPQLSIELLTLYLSAFQELLTSSWQHWHLEYTSHMYGRGKMTTISQPYVMTTHQLDSHEQISLQKQPPEALSPCETLSHTYHAERIKNKHFTSEASTRNLYARIDGINSQGALVLTDIHAQTHILTSADVGLADHSQHDSRAALSQRELSSGFSPTNCSHNATKIKENLT
ncbi:MAG: biotin--[acetyl-CoA-carboxylase] ligase [Actinomycetaceae bacterium]|nr:biotin--[acetyl-CoA-carboxylase] ligase [Actinomycetaceae bacterium]